MDAQIDCRVLELDLGATILELDLRADANEVTDPRVREQIEALRLESGVVPSAVDTLQSRVYFRVATERRSTTKPRKKRLVVHPTPHERPLDGVPRRSG